MNAESTPRFVVLAAIDESALAGAELHFVHVVPWVPSSSSLSQRAAGFDASSMLENARVRLVETARASRFGREVVCHIALGDPAQDHRTLAPEIQPPCPACLEAQRATHGKTLWCARHAARHPTAHVHYELPEPFAVGSMTVRP